MLRSLAAGKPWSVEKSVWGLQGVVSHRLQDAKESPQPSALLDLEDSHVSTWKRASNQIHNCPRHWPPLEFTLSLKYMYSIVQWYSTRGNKDARLWLSLEF